MNRSCVLYTDGGIIGPNPSKHGGTWAFTVTMDEIIVSRHSGVVFPSDYHVGEITNNQSELIALIKGLSSLEPDWRGTVMSDSMVSLGRVFLGHAMNNVPLRMKIELIKAQQRLYCWGTDDIGWLLLDGHPTKKQLDVGIGKRGNPVSRHQKWCDNECSGLSREYKNVTGVTFEK